MSLTISIGSIPSSGFIYNMTISRIQIFEWIHVYIYGTIWNIYVYIYTYDVSRLINTTGSVDDVVSTCCAWHPKPRESIQYLLSLPLVSLALVSFPRALRGHHTVYCVKFRFLIYMCIKIFFYMLLKIYSKHKIKWSGYGFCF